MNHIFDSHAHYDDERFDEDREALLSSLPERGVCAVVNVGNSTTANLAGIALAKRFPFLFCSVGIHPEQAGEVANSPSYLSVLAAQAALPKVCAIGEIGLDYYYKDAVAPDIQKKVFEEQLVLACERNLPVIIHDREAHQDSLELLRKYRPQGIVHCFSGSAEMAQEIVKLGMYVGFTGVLSFKNARRAVEAAAVVPLDRLLVETDCPYMAPEPYRGKRCDSSMVEQVILKLAQIRGEEPQRMADISCENARRVYRLE